MADEEGHCEIRQIGCSAYYAVAIDRFQRDKRDPSVIVFSEIKRCQHPHFTQFFQKQKKVLKQPGTSGCAVVIAFVASAPPPISAGQLRSATLAADDAICKIRKN